MPKQFDKYTYETYGKVRNYYAIDYINDYALVVRTGITEFGEQKFPTIKTTCIVNAEENKALEITKEKFDSAYHKAINKLSTLF
jgi:hypothetical protein